MARNFGGGKMGKDAGAGSGVAGGAMEAVQAVQAVGLAGPVQLGRLGT